jgi:NhaP-type Na+/H+ or K+/H+ antiporter
MVLNTLMLSAEMVCFVYIGLSLIDTFTLHYENIAIAAIILLFMLISRVLCLSLFAYIYRNNDKIRIRGKEWVFVGFSGIIKGPITYIFANVIVAKSVPCLDIHNAAIYKTV